LKWRRQFSVPLRLGSGQYCFNGELDPVLRWTGKRHETIPFECAVRHERSGRQRMRNERGFRITRPSRFELFDTGAGGHVQ
jgi:hypothetical protein